VKPVEIDFGPHTDISILGPGMFFLHFYSCIPNAKNLHSSVLDSRGFVALSIRVFPLFLRFFYSFVLILTNRASDTKERPPGFSPLVITEKDTSARLKRMMDTTRQESMTKQAAPAAKPLRDRAEAYLVFLELC
jgi:hypothetical protein